jgi:hypothetical protein
MDVTQFESVQSLSLGQRRNLRDNRGRRQGIRRVLGSIEECSNPGAKSERKANGEEPVHGGEIDGFHQYGGKREEKQGGRLGKWVLGGVEGGGCFCKFTILIF